MKTILTVGVYLALVFALGMVTAFTARPEENEAAGSDDDLELAPG